MKDILQTSRLLECKHEEMLLELIDCFTLFKKTKGYSKEDYTLLVYEVLGFISQRCKKKEFVDSYKLLILHKIEDAFHIVLDIKVDNDFEYSEDMLDIPIEEFEDAYTDEDFLKKLTGENE